MMIMVHEIFNLLVGEIKVNNNREFIDSIEYIKVFILAEILEFKDISSTYLR